MSKVTALVFVQLIVLSTIECMVDGKKQTFLPSEKPQDIPKADADEALSRGLAKPVESEEEIADENAPNPGGAKDLVSDTKDKTSV